MPVTPILLAFAGAAPAALASPAPPHPPGWNKHPPVPVPARVEVIGGMPGWQITLVVIGAALLAATAAVREHRAWAARRRPGTVAPEPGVQQRPCATALPAR